MTHPYRSYLRRRHLRHTARMCHRRRQRLAWGSPVTMTPDSLLADPPNLGEHRLRRELSRQRARRRDRRTKGGRAAS